MLSIRELLSLLTFSNRDITTVMIFAVAIGLLSLVVPIAAQGLVTIVSFGNLRQPLVVLAIVVFVLLIFSGISRILQSILIETVQQRMFASIALKIAKRLPRIDMVTLDENHGSDLLNKFFDVITLQKSIADILVNVSAFALQALLGMLLLALYHPVLIAFNAIFVAILLLIIMLPYARGIETALQESDAKYAVVGWLKELTRVPLMFHFQNSAAFGFQKADDIVVRYLKARQAHYKVIIRHMIGAYGLQALASTSLFVVGGLLVLNNQMTLGQLVAAEIVVTTLSARAATIPRNMEKFYDLRAAAEKVNSLLDLPVESSFDMSDPLVSHIGPFINPPQLIVKDLVLPGDVTNKINFTVDAGSSLVISLSSQVGRNLLTDALLGLRAPLSGEVHYNKIPLTNYPLNELRKTIAFVRNAEFFDGALLDNITIGNSSVSIEDVIKLLDSFALGEFISSLPQGLKFQLTGSCAPFTQMQLIELMFVREIISQPLLMVIDEAFDLFPVSEVKHTLEMIQQNCQELTLLVTTRRAEVAELFNNRIDL